MFLFQLLATPSMQIECVYAWRCLQSCIPCGTLSLRLNFVFSVAFRCARSNKLCTKYLDNFGFDLNKTLPHPAMNCRTLAKGNVIYFGVFLWAFCEFFFTNFFFETLLAFVNNDANEPVAFVCQDALNRFWIAKICDLREREKKDCVWRCLCLHYWCWSLSLSISISLWLKWLVCIACRMLCLLSGVYQNSSHLPINTSKIRLSK